MSLKHTQQIIGQVLQLHLEENVGYFGVSDFEFLEWTISHNRETNLRRRDYWVALRCKREGYLVGFVCCRPCKLKLPLDESLIPTCEVRSLYVHPKWRKHGLAVVLIGEMDRTIRKFGIAKVGVYTASFPVTVPVCKTRYFKRALNLCKLVEHGLWEIRANASLVRELRMLEENLNERGSLAVRRMKSEDEKALIPFLNKYQEKFKLHTVFDKKEFHYFFMQNDSMRCLVAEVSIYFLISF